MSDESFKYSNSNMAESTDAAKPGETKPDATLLAGEPAPEPKPEPRPQSDDPDRNFFGDSMRAEMDKTLDPVFAAEQINPLDPAAVAEQSARRQQAVDVAFQAGFEVADLKEVDGLLREYAVMGPEDIQARTAETYAVYKKEVPDRADSNLQLARAYLERPEHARLRAWLSVTGLGSDIRVVRRVVSIARAAAVRGPSKK
jgi:hypothetical protein